MIDWFRASPISSSERLLISPAIEGQIVQINNGTAARTNSIHLEVGQQHGRPSQGIRRRYSGVDGRYLAVENRSLVSDHAGIIARIADLNGMPRVATPIARVAIGA